MPLSMHAGSQVQKRHTFLGRINPFRADCLPRSVFRIPKTELFFRTSVFIGTGVGKQTERKKLLFSFWELRETESGMLPHIHTLSAPMFRGGILLGRINPFKANCLLRSAFVYRNANFSSTVFLQRRSVGKQTRGKITFSFGSEEKRFSPLFFQNNRN
ncbi:hypothetical protein CEXT_467281 [Caerostris extrusa]|uniref:Uncharacterized protein n=1 Tax=Caerostris extrusa TaxID=172846 RepID=A0AAV4X413_CAEEX|nr:hypothetical protein CEXT_467281 [Caerostris extrusa]